MKPLAVWSDDQSSSEALVWWTRLDSQWQVEVQRTGPYQAVLCIFDHANEDHLVHQEPVSLAYDAVVGPDMDDVMFWQEKAIGYVDSRPAPKDGGPAADPPAR